MSQSQFSKYSFPLCFFLSDGYPTTYPFSLSDIAMFDCIVSPYNIEKISNDKNVFSLSAVKLEVLLCYGLVKRLITLNDIQDIFVIK